MVTDARIHQFEQAGLGKAPFRLVHFEISVFQACPGEPVRAGTSCDYCGTSIKNVYWIQGAEGDHRFKVGSECVKKTCDAGMISRVKGIERKAVKVRQAARIARAWGLLATEEIRELLSGEPHPQAWRAEKGETELTGAEWMMRNSGNAGRIRTAKVLEGAAKKLSLDLSTVGPMSRDEYVAAMEPPELQEEIAPEPEPKISDWMGEVGERITADVEIISKIGFQGHFGPVTIYKFETTEEGNRLVWFNSGADLEDSASNPLREGALLTITGTVKAHKRHDGAKETTLTRCVRVKG